VGRPALSREGPRPRFRMEVAAGRARGFPACASSVNSSLRARSGGEQTPRCFHVDEQGGERGRRGARKVREKGGHNSIPGPNVVTPSPKRSRSMRERCIHRTCHCFCRAARAPIGVVFDAACSDDAARASFEEESSAARERRR